jgi:hypothetical protein
MMLEQAEMLPTTTLTLAPANGVLVELLSLTVQRLMEVKLG